MKKSVFYFFLISVSLAIIGCHKHHLPYQESQISSGAQFLPKNINIHIADHSSNINLPNVTVTKNNASPVLSDIDGNVKGLNIVANDKLDFKKEKYSPTTITFENPNHLEGLTVFMQTSATSITKSVFGHVTTDGVPCGLLKIFNLDKPSEFTYCKKKSGRYKLKFSTPSPYRIGYAIDTTQIIKLKIEGNTTIKVDVAIVNAD